MASRISAALFAPPNAFTWGMPVGWAISTGGAQHDVLVGEVLRAGGAEGVKGASGMAYEKVVLGRGERALKGVSASGVS